MVKKKLVKSSKNKVNLKKDFSLRRIYRESFSFLFESKWYILFSVCVFFICFLVGFIFPSLGTEFIRNWIQELLSQTEGFNFFQFWWFIFKNNSLVSLTAILLGFFFGIFPFLTLIFNGYIIGLVARLSVDAVGVYELWRLLPHGIFELPAVLISISLGIKFGSFVFNKNPWKRFKYLLSNSLQVFFFIILPLLLIAALIESLLIIGLK